MLSPTQGKTTLLAVHPDYKGTGLGYALQARRMDALVALGVEELTTNADRPEIIAWYKKHFGYREVGTLQKFHEFGLPDVDHWTTLRTDLRQWARRDSDGGRGWALATAIWRVSTPSVPGASGRRSSSTSA